MNDLQVHAIAQELMDIQMGSAEDAIALLDDSLTPDERRRVEGEIRQIAWEMEEDLK
jgi:hypothetical protein